MYYQIEDGEQREKIEKYLKRMGVTFTTAKTLEQMHVLDTIDLVHQIFDNMPFDFLNHKKVTKFKSYGEQVAVIDKVLGELRENAQEIALAEPLYDKLRDSIVKKCEEAINEATRNRPEKKGGVRCE